MTITDTNLTILNGLSNLTSISRSLVIKDNSSLNGLNKLEQIGHEFKLHNNVNLLNIDGLDVLTKIGEGNTNYDMEIWSNDSLQNLDGLSSLLIVGGKISIHANDVINDFCGLQNILNNGSYDSYGATSNDFDPTAQDIIDGNCSQ